MQDEKNGWLREGLQGIRFRAAAQAAVIPARAREVRQAVPVPAREAEMSTGESAGGCRRYFIYGVF